MEEPSTEMIKILLMDDEDMIRDVAGQMFDIFGFEVDLVDEGQKAVDLYRVAFEKNSPYDLVILDISVPDGWGAREAIKELISIDKNVKAVISSGYQDDPMVLHHERYNFCGVIQKPYDIEEVEKAIRSLLST